jgi:hypothetical protein
MVSIDLGSQSLKPRADILVLQPKSRFQDQTILLVAKEVTIHARGYLVQSLMLTREQIKPLLETDKIVPSRFTQVSIDL